MRLVKFSECGGEGEAVCKDVSHVSAKSTL